MNYKQRMLKRLIESFEPYNEQEVVDKESMINFINTFDNVLYRDNVHGHFTATAFVVNESCNKALMLHHNIMGDWICPGGHADGECDLYSVALREVEEETGLKVSPLFDTNPYSIQAAPVKGHVKKGKYISAHVHYDVLYVFKASDEDMNKIRILPDENTAVEWWDFNKVLSDPNVVDWAKPIFAKLLNRMGINQ